MSDIAHELSTVPPAPSVATVGNFDGVHRGHQTLLRRAVHAAADAGMRAVAVTFEPHPAAVLDPAAVPLRLQSLQERVEMLAAAGVDLVLVLPFTREVAELEPAEFVGRVLVDRLRAVRVVVGVNFRFGRRAAGDVAVLASLGADHGFVAEAVTLTEQDGVAISSTSIREHLAGGDVGWARRALGRPYALTGTVIAGEGRGRTIGVPTANLAVGEDRVLPADGVYAGHARVEGIDHPAVTNVGLRPTFGAGGRTVECHLLDGDHDLYARDLRITFEHRLRGERRFDGVDQLVDQIRRDVDQAKGLLAGG